MIAPAFAGQDEPAPNREEARHGRRPGTDEDPGPGESDETLHDPLTDSEADPPQKGWGEGPDND
jgi:hypothetical protein